MTPILFLDFDGVLHPTSARPAERFSRAHLLSSSLAEHNCDVVVSSSWRFHHTFEALIAPLPLALRRRVTGTTGEPRFGRWPRYSEIQAFLLEFGPNAHWRALDDSANEFPPGCPELLSCDPNVGLAARQLNELNLWLRST